MTKKKSSEEWTIASLRVSLEERIEAVDRRLDERIEAADIAVVIARKAQQDQHTLFIEEMKQRIDDRDGFLERLATEREHQVTVSFAAAKEAVNKAEMATEKRFEGVNEFRSQLADQARTFIPRNEVEQAVAALKQYTEALVDNNRTTITAAMDAAKEAVAKAEIANERRFASVNEFRAALTDQTATFISRPEYSVQFAAVTDRISALEKVTAEGGGRDQGIDKTEMRAFQQSNAIKQTITVAVYVALFLITFVGFILAYVTKK